MKGKGIRGVYILSALFLLIFHGISFAQDAKVQKSNWLLSVIFKLEDMRARAMEDIQKYEGEIRKCDNTISKSENIVRLAQEQGNAKAEEIVREASSKAQAAKTKNIELKNSAEFNKKKAEIALAHVKNEFSDALGNPQKIKSVITNYSGRVSIQKNSGEIMDFRNNQSGLLERGDEIVTYGDSSAELQFLDGRGTMKVGPNSQVKMEEDGAGTQAMSMIRGKINVSVEKLENYQKMMGEKIKAYKEDIRKVKDETTQKIVDEWESLNKSLESYHNKHRKKFEVRTISWAMAPRGTRFLVYEDEKKGTEVIVLEGSVEIKSKIGNITIVVNEGYRVAAVKDGKLSEPEKIEISNLDRGWEK